MLLTFTDKNKKLSRSERKRNGSYFLVIETVQTGQLHAQVRLHFNLTSLTVVENDNVVVRHIITFLNKKFSLKY